MASLLQLSQIACYKEELSPSTISERFAGASLVDGSETLSVESRPLLRALCGLYLAPLCNAQRKTTTG